MSPRQPPQPSGADLSRSVEAQGLAALLNLEAHLALGRLPSEAAAPEPSAPAGAAQPPARAPVAGAAARADAAGAANLGVSKGYAAGARDAQAAGPVRGGEAEPRNPDFVDTEAAQPYSADATQRHAVHADHAPAANAAPLGRIGPYELRAVMAHDGLGQVFMAWDSNDRVDVMLTLLDLEVEAPGREAVISKLQKSVLQAAALQHPGLVRIHDAGVVGQGVYIVNEWISGRSLGLAQRAGWQPTARVAAALVRDLAQAMAHAHAHGVLHGGLNPSTVLLDANDRALVLGLGYAGPAHASDLPSMDPLVSGAAPYLAPEQLQGGAIDERTDVHALGVLLYELLAGHRAYPGETVPEVARALMTHDPAPPHWLRLDVPERLSAIAMQALQRNPAARYAQVGQVAQALNAWLEQSEQEVGDARDYLESVKKQPKSHKRRTQQLAAALLVAAAAAAAFALLDKPATGPAGAPGRDVLAPSTVGSGAVSGVVTSDAAAPGGEPAVALPGAPPAADTGLAEQGVPATNLPPQAEPINTRAADAVKSAALGVDNAKPLAAGAPAEPTSAQGAAGVVAPSLQPAPPLGGAAAAAVSKLEMAPVVAEAPAPRAAPAQTPPRPTAAQARTPPPAAKPAVRERPRPPAAEARTAAPPGVAQTGTVTLAVSPWGYVDVGGKPAGASPPLHKLTLPEGTHTITIRNEDFAPFVTTVQVSADKAATVRHRFPQ